MEAINRLRRSGMTTRQIAEAIKDDSGGHLVRLYERGKRFPSRRTYVCIVEVAEARGLLLTARDFIAEERCEPDAANDSEGR
jgi:hypothetical protein